jgi:uncharacterized Zn-binding protein involved in type VI secretion
MVNKLLIGVGIVALVAVGSIGVWQLAAGDGGRRVGALGDEPLSEGPSGTIQWRGEFDAEAGYQPMDVVSYKGSSWIAKAEAKAVTPPDEPWDVLAQAGDPGPQGVQGVQGPAGTFTGVLQSPDGTYRLSVTNAGIEASGPNGRVMIDNGGVVVRSGLRLVLEASTTASVRGATVLLNCASGGTPVARQGGPVQVNTQNGTGQILQGSTTVLAC